MTISDFDKSMEVDFVNDNQQLGGLERENLSETSLKYIQFFTDPKFLRGVFYTTIPISICSIILIMAYRRDLLSARSTTTSTVFRIPVFLIAVFALSAPFIIKYGDEAFLNLFPKYPDLGPFGLAPQPGQAQPVASAGVGGGALPQGGGALPQGGGAIPQLKPVAGAAGGIGGAAPAPGGVGGAKDVDD